MARNQAYPVELVQNFSDAVRQHNPRDYGSRPSMATDLMILRALLNHPLVDPARHQVSPADLKSSGSVEQSTSLRSPTH